jgi:hypothetical protein
MKSVSFFEVGERVERARGRHKEKKDINAVS